MADEFRSICTEIAHSGTILTNAQVVIVLLQQWTMYVVNAFLQSELFSNTLIEQNTRQMAHLYTWNGRKGLSRKLTYSQISDLTPR
jgi:hypothetical protein